MTNDVRKHKENVERFTSHNIFLIGVVIRCIVFYYDDFFKHSPQFVAPNNSFKRFREGVFLYDSGLDPYKSDMFHMLPMFIVLFRPLLNIPHACEILWIGFDCLTSYFVGQFAFTYSSRIGKDPQRRAANVRNLAIMGYLLNPMTVGACAAYSFASLTNTLLALFMCALIKEKAKLSVICVAIASSLNVYYISLLAPIFVHFRTVWTLLVTITLALIALIAINVSLVDSPMLLFRGTIGFFFMVTDLTPNCGIFWYFFAQIFQHYRLLFLFAFQINAFIYVVPLSATLRNNVHLLAVALLISVSITSSYPSYAEAAIYLPLLLAFVDFHKYIRYSLIIAATLVTSTILMPVMWRMWVITGTGNANFFFAIVSVYIFAQIILFCDVVSAFLRAQVLQENELANEEHKIDYIKFIDPVLF